MAPPKIWDKTSSTQGWSTGAPAPAGKADCSKCHSDSTIQNYSPNVLLNQPNTKWFLDTKPKGNSLFDPQQLAAVQAWIDASPVDAFDPPPSAPTTVVAFQDPAPTPVTSATPTAAPAPVPATIPGATPSADEAKAFVEKAKAEENQARLATDPEKKLHRYQLAYLHFLSAKDAPEAKRILELIKQEYEKQKNPVGLKMVAADALVLEGKLVEALDAYLLLECDLQAIGPQTWESSRAPLLKEVDGKISWALRTLAAQRLEQHNRGAAASFLEMLLKRHPSASLLKETLSLLHAERGTLRELRTGIEDLEMKSSLKRARPCQVSCHSNNQPRVDLKFKDYQALHGSSPLLQGIGGVYSQPQIDLSAYDDLSHLSWDKKQELFWIDNELADQRSKLPSATERVTRLLRTYYGEGWNGDVEAEEIRLLGEPPKKPEAEKVSAQLLVGELYLDAKEYAKAAEAFETAAKGQNFEPTAQVGLGKAYFGQEQYKKAFEAYGAYTALNPRDASILRLRVEAAEKYAATLDKTKDATEIARVSTEVQKDNAMLLALGAKGEKERLAQLEAKLGELHDSPLKADLITSLEGLGQQYLTLSGEAFSDIKDLELVRGELNGLAAETFAVLQRFAKADSDPAIQKTASLYEAYALMANGKLDEGVKILETIRKEVPAAEKILAKLEADKLKFANLAAIEAWEAYNQEGESIQGDNQGGILGGVVNYGGKLFTWDSDYSIHDQRRAQWKSQRDLVAELKSRIESGKAKTIWEGLEQIRADGSDHLKSAANSQHLATMYKGHPIGPMIQFVSQLPPDPMWTETLLRTTFELEADNNAVQSPFALYSLVHAFTKGTSSEGMSFNGTAWDHMEALQGRGSFGRSAMKFIFGTSPEMLAVDVGLLVASAGLGTVARLAMLTRLEQAGVTGYKALAIATAAGIGVEATALWAGNLGKEAMLRDPSKVFTAEHLAKSYGSTLLMIGGLKGFGKLGETVGPRAAKGFGLVTEGGAKLTAGGKALVWGIGHGSGLSGMITTSHLSQGLGLTPKPIGGWKEGLVHDVFGYVQFAVAHKTADRLFAGKLSTIAKKQHSEIAVKEAFLLAKSHADRMGFKATRGPKGELVESPERQALVTMLVEASLGQPGFNGGKLAKLVETRQYEKANQYFLENGLPLQVGKGGNFYVVALGAKSPHEAIGIEPVKPQPAKKRPAKKPEPLRKDVLEAVNQILDSIANFLFPGGGGGFGMQLAFAGAYNMVAGKKSANPAKKSNAMQMSSLENFELGLMDRNVSVASHDFVKNPTNVTVKLEAKKAEDLPFIAETAIKELPKEVKKLQIVLEKEAGLGFLTEMVKLAKDRGIEIVIGQEKTNGHTEFVPQFRIVDGKVRVYTEQAPSFDVLSAMALISKEKGFDISIGKEVVNGKTEWVPQFDVVAGQIRLREAPVSDVLAKALDSKQELQLFDGKGKLLVDIKKDTVTLERPELLDAALIAAVQAKRTLTVKTKAETYSVEVTSNGISVKLGKDGTLYYKAAAGSSRPQLIVDVPPGAKPEKVQSLLRVAIAMDPALFKDARIEFKGLDPNFGGPLKGLAAQFTRKALWGGCESLVLGKGLSIGKAGPKSNLTYALTTSNPLSQVNKIYAELLAYETASARGAKSASDPKVGEMAEFWQAAMQQAIVYDRHLDPNKSHGMDRVKKIREKAGYQKYLEHDFLRQWQMDPNKVQWAMELPSAAARTDWVVQWNHAAEAMLDYGKKSPANQQRLNQAFDLIRSHSQKEAGHLLDFTHFDGRAYADNAFELTRIFNEARLDPKISLDPILKEVGETLGSSGKLELFGATIGMIYKARIPQGYDSRGTPKYDSASVNELNRFKEMRNEAAASGQALRLTVLPEDYHQGSNYGTPSFTKTPEWIVEKLGSDGRTEKLLSVEVKNRDGSKVQPHEIDKMVQDAVYQVTGHEFKAGFANGESLVVIKFHSAKGLEGDIVADVQQALSKEYQNRLRLQKSGDPKHRGKADKMRRMHVKIIFEDGNTSSATWLEPAGLQWNQRAVNGAQFSVGTKWLEPFQKAVGWN